MSKDVVYIFISHSHYDIDKVRPIRNYLESIGAEPILFFLKSKTDDDEIEQLIKDEIDARVWFIYCKSSHAETSKWVKKEREYVKFKGKRNITIDIDSCLDLNGDLTLETNQKLDIIVDNFRSLQKLFISYSHKDSEIARKIQKQLNIYGINSYYDLNSIVNLDFKYTIKDEIMQSDFYLILLSTKSIDSMWVQKELEFAMTFQKAIIPVIMYENYDQREIILNNDWFHQHLAVFNCILFNVSNNEAIDESVNQLVNELIRIVFGIS